MKAINTLKIVKAALKKESEYELSYLHGIKLDSFDHIKKIRGRFQGLFLNICKFFIAVFVIFAFLVETCL